jgi:two-component system, cell cycle sensor histidine kinase PleC
MESLAFGAVTPVGRKDRVLVVDDEPQVLLALEEALSDWFDVSTTDNPARAVRLLENEDEIAVVVADQRMPGMNGDELFRRVRDRSKATRVLVTGYADLEAVVRAVNEGNIFAYITKPWDTPDLLSKLAQAAERFRSAVSSTRNDGSSTSS